MWKDRLLKRGWRLFVRVLYIVMVVAIVIRIFPLNEGFRNAITIVQVLTAVSILVFAWFYYNRPELVKNEELE